MVKEVDVEMFQMKDCKVQIMNEEAIDMAQAQKRAFYFVLSLAPYLKGREHKQCRPH